MAFVLTGAAINPARAFGPQLVANHWGDDWWVWYVGPFAGGVIAAVLYELLYLRRDEPVGMVAQAEAGEPLEPVQPGMVDEPDVVVNATSETIVIEAGESATPEETPRWPAEDEPPATGASS